ncbi:MAG: putative membrane protein YdjX (TVP38/TMEM64 family) [Gammaproteobacteria bacterium]|jgi:uncharacterized membrane protein YdjX (TVP38/TMEM64 family)
MIKANIIRLIVVLGIILISAEFFILGFHHYLTIEKLIEVKTVLSEFKTNFPLYTVIIFFLLYVIGTGLSLPVAGFLTITSGVLFGLFWGTLIVSVAGTVGATIAFLLSRYLFRDYIQSRYAEKLSRINNGITKNGNMYLLSLRLIPVIPFFIINAGMGLTPIPVVSFSLISIIGMVPISLILVNGGVQLVAINTIKDIMSPQVIVSLSLIACIPFLAHYITVRFNDKELLK